MKTGDMIGHYRVLSKLGQGGMGVVYKALDTRLDRLVALKVVDTESVSASGRIRFGREAKAASALNHPNIITIYDFDTADGVQFIAMELVQGSALNEILLQGSMPLPTILRVARQMADALAKAHSATITHRDLKPSNIMVTEDGLVKVLDFGLAKRTWEPTSGGEGETMTALTRAGEAVGTPAYMSPEQALGEQIDHRSDIFSFGIVLYEMVTGKRPFHGERRLEMLNAVAYQAAPDSGTLRADIPSQIHRLIERCLVKNRDERLQTMREVCAELDRVSQSLLSVTDPVTMTSGGAAASRRPDLPRPGDASRRNYYIGALLIATVFALLIYFKGAGVGNGPVKAPATPRTAYENYQLGSSLIERFDRKGNIDRAIESLRKAIEMDKDMAPAYALLSEAYRHKNRETPDNQWVRMSRDLASQAVRLNPDLALSRVAMGRLLWTEENLDAAEVEARRAIQLDPRSAAARRLLGQVLASRSDVAAAETELRAAIGLEPQDWRNTSELAVFFFKNARYREAISAFQSAIRLAPDVELLHGSLAGAFHMVGEYEAAASEFQKALEIRPSATVYNNLGTLRFFQGRYADAVPAFEKAVEMRAGSFAFWGNLGDAYRWGPGTKERAKPAYMRAVQMARKELQAKPGSHEIRSRLAIYLAKLGDLRAARGELAALPTSGKTAAILFREMIVWELLGERGHALASLGQAIQAGYAIGEIENEPELVSLRADRRYHVLMASRQK